MSQSSGEDCRTPAAATTTGSCNLHLAIPAFDDKSTSASQQSSPHRSRTITMSDLLTDQEAADDENSSFLFFEQYCADSEPNAKKRKTLAESESQFLEPDGTDIRYLQFLANQRSTRHTGRARPSRYVPSPHQIPSRKPKPTIYARARLPPPKVTTKRNSPTHKQLPKNVFELADEVLQSSTRTATATCLPPPVTPSRNLSVSDLNSIQCSSPQTAPQQSPVPATPVVSSKSGPPNPLHSIVRPEVLDGECDELLFSARSDCLPFPEWNADPSKGECTEIALDYLVDFKSIMERKLEHETDASLTQQTQSAPKSRSTVAKSEPSSVIHSWKGGHYITCDLRYFNLASIGKFDVVLVDPPWRISGANAHASGSNMFSNNPFNLDYNTLSNQEIFDIDVGSLSEHGFCFLWVINSALQLGLECLNNWGYTFVDRLTWVKRTSRGCLSVTHGYYFLHSSEICLVGVKYKRGHKLQYMSKVTNDVIIGEVRKKSQKPDELYHIIDRMMPGGRKIELFAKNHNIRAGWLSLGNRLGPNYDTDWKYNFTCDVCNLQIKPGTKRFKSKSEPNKDLCASCLEHLLVKAQSNVSSSVVLDEETDKDGGSPRSTDYNAIDGDEPDHTDDPPNDAHRSTLTSEDSEISTKKAANQEPINVNDFFELENAMDEVAFHDWYTCDVCKMYPICGVRLSCRSCSDFDVCEGCFDVHILGGEDSEGRQVPKGSYHPIDHEFEAIECPTAGDGFSVHHRVRCHSCLACPIIGERLFCTTCSTNLCRKCFFMKKEPRGHASTHNIVLIPEALKIHPKNVKCVLCKAKPIQGPFFRCNSCLNLDICDTCFPKHDQEFPCELYPAHKKYHKFTRVA